MRKVFKDIVIEHDYISVFGSGTSINNMSDDEIDAIRSNSFMITMNYAPIKLTGHLNMWSDKKVTAFLQDHYEKSPKNCLFLARDKSMVTNKISLFKKVDYWFNERQEKIKGNYTIVWLLQMLERHFPQKKVLIFGMDMAVIDDRRAKWYDDHTDYDYRKRGRVNTARKLNICADQLDRYVKRTDMFVNCNVDSNYNGFEKKNWKEALECVS